MNQAEVIPLFSKNLGSNTELNLAGQFQRLEDKYLLSEQDYNELLPLLQLYMINASPVINTQFTLIESVYYDNKNLDVLSEYLNQNLVRSKMRTRRYAPNGLFSSDIFLEVKSKTNGVSQKSRFQISSLDLEQINSGQLLESSEKINSLNSNIPTEKLNRRLDRVNQFITNKSIKPSCRVSYKRVAFEIGSLRVTLDKNIKFLQLLNISKEVKSDILNNLIWKKTLEQTQNAYSNGTCILEVKHDGNIPRWLKLFLQARSLNETGFSKYCFAMSYGLI